jgi:hypothetical protein
MTDITLIAPPISKAAGGRTLKATESLCAVCQARTPCHQVQIKKEVPWNLAFFIRNFKIAQR